MTVMKFMENSDFICPVCKNAVLSRSFEAKDYISSEPFVVYKCSHCGSAVIKLQSPGKGIVEYYNERYYGRRKSFVENFINYGREMEVMKFAKEKPSPPFLLDIGCGNGTFLMSMRACGWSAVGTEIAPPEHLLIGAKSFIYKGDLKGQKFANNSFNAITMWHSLEHLSDLQEYLVEIKRILRPEGVLIIEVPNFQSLQAIIFKENWFHLDVPRHLFHFSPKGITLLLKEIGFSEIRVFPGSFIYEFFGYLQSILNVLTKRKNLLFDFLNHKIAWRDVYKKHFKDLALNAIVLVPAAIISVFLFVVALVAGKSGIMGVSARKS